MRLACVFTGGETAFLTIFLSSAKVPLLHVCTSLLINMSISIIQAYDAECYS